jgi:hypothetical protein
MEVYAGMITGVDRAVGKIVAELEALGVRDDTLIMLFSDNGASAEGTTAGTPNIFAPAFGREVPIEKAAEMLDQMGEDGSFPHYPIGWTNASGTPYRLYKQYAALGGVADPLIVSWPKTVDEKGAVRRQFVHVVDLFPTILEACGVKRPELYLGEHVVLFDDPADEYRQSDDGTAFFPSMANLPDPIQTLTYLAACTSRIRLATGVVILPQRNPVYTAKHVATLDWLSGGRFDFTIGTGWRSEEYAACATPFDARGERCRLTGNQLGMRDSERELQDKAPK